MASKRKHGLHQSVASHRAYCGHARPKGYPMMFVIVSRLRSHLADGGEHGLVQGRVQGSIDDLHTATHVGAPRRCTNDGGVHQLANTDTRPKEEQLCTDMSEGPQARLAYP
jgi:hypothetical protein